MRLRVAISSLLRVCMVLNAVLLFSLLPSSSLLLQKLFIVLFPRLFFASKFSLVDMKI